MIISYKYKLVFIHIPKNAGTFVYNLLIKIDPACIDIRTDGFGHQEYNFIKKMDIFEKIKDFIFFAIIRNPFDRIISYYNFTYKLFNKNSFTLRSSKERDLWMKINEDNFVKHLKMSMQICMLF